MNYTESKVTDKFQGQCVCTLLMDCAGAKIKLLDHIIWHVIPHFEALQL